jgi:hypothetical protein
MTAYAQDTKVPVDRSRAEIERNLIRFQASGFSYGWSKGRKAVEFVYMDKRVRMTLTMPARDDWKAREAADLRSDDRYDKERRRRWRSLGMIVKAKLVAVTDGITTFEDEFLSYFVMPGGATIGEAVIPRLNQAALHGHLPPLLEDHRLSPAERERL